jgi:uncharacterized protein YegP (UPF0339 family)
MGKFVIKTGKDGQFYFNLKASNGEIILSSEGYTTKPSCKNGIASVKKNAADTSKFEKAVSKNGKPYFNLRAGNRQVIGKSEMYESEKACNNGIASVKKNAPGAKIEG